MVLLCVLAQPVWAHNVVGGVYALGTEIEGEAGFSNGDMAKAGLTVEVLDALGQVLGTTVTEEEGMFRFQASQRIDHHFRIEMGAGHLLEVSLPADELPESLPGGDPSLVTVSAAVVTGAAVGAGLNATQIQLMVEKAVARQVKPLRKELNAYKEKAGLRDILGGIGYIFGLCGLGIMLRQRKQEN